MESIEEVNKKRGNAFTYAAAVPFILPAGTDAKRFTGLSDAVIRFEPIDIDGQQYGTDKAFYKKINAENK